MQTIRFLLAGMFVLLIFNCNVMAYDKNDVIFGSISQYEDLTEYALDRNTVKVADSILSLNGLIEELGHVISNKSIHVGLCGE